MIAAEIQNVINMYSMVRFSDGHREPGIIMNKYNEVHGHIDYFFVQHNSLNDFKKAQDRSDYLTCDKLSSPIDIQEIISISPINLSDYKAILELHGEYRQTPRMHNG